MRVAPLVLAAILALGVALNLGCGRSGLLDGLPSSSPEDSGAGASSGAGAPGSPGTPEDAGAELDATNGATDAGGAPTSKDAHAPAACNPFTCPNGCCLTDGTCFVSTGAPTDPCGSNGEACATCPKGDTCFPGGGCQHATSGTCSPANCNGCCALSTMCFEGSQDLWCGSGGAPCQGCSPSISGGHCVADPGAGGHCEGAGTCSATNCAGCCAGKLCVVGTQNVGCGSAGAACQDCTSDAGICMSIGAPDGLFNLCGYQCSFGTSPLDPCNVLCTSVGDCFSPAELPQHDL